MSQYILKIDDGIFIDRKCTEIKEISYGYFIPVCPSGRDCDESGKSYRDALDEFIDKWFPGSEHWEKEVD